MASLDRVTHLPIRIRPYIAEVMTMTWPRLHVALNVSQLQYSLAISDKYRKGGLWLVLLLYHDLLGLLTLIEGSSR